MGKTVWDVNSYTVLLTKKTWFPFLFWNICFVFFYITNNWKTGHFIMFCVISNIYNKKTKGSTLMELFTATGKLKKFFLTTRNVRCVYFGWHGTHQYDTQVLLGTDYCRSEEYRYTHVDVCVARTWILYWCVPCHPLCTHQISLVIKKKFLSFPVAVNNSIKIGPLVFLL
jgi:hypothetical protein